MYNPVKRFEAPFTSIITVACKLTLQIFVNEWNVEVIFEMRFYTAKSMKMSVKHQPQLLLDLLISSLWNSIGTVCSFWTSYLSPLLHSHFIVVFRFVTSSNLGGEFHNNTEQHSYNKV